jgi:site-specific DNA recombinase
MQQPGGGRLTGASTIPEPRRDGPGRRQLSCPGPVRCAIYTRSSVGPESGLRHFTADAQREVVEAFIARHSHEGWVALAERYDDAGFTGRTMGRPALNRLLADALWGALDCIVVYRVDRMSRSFLDFGRILGILSGSGVGFVSATEPFDTRDTTGHLMLNMLDAFAQFERETLAERLRDKKSSMRRKGKHVGGTPPLGYRLDRETRRIVPDEGEAGLVREIFELYLGRPSTVYVAEELNRRGRRTRAWTGRDGRRYGGARSTRDGFGRSSRTSRTPAR